MLNVKSYLFFSPTLSQAFYRYISYYPDDDPQLILKQFNSDLLIALTPEMGSNESDFYLDYGEETFTEVIIEQAILNSFRDLNIPEEAFYRVSEFYLLTPSGMTNLVIQQG